MASMSSYPETGAKKLYYFQGSRNYEVCYDTFVQIYPSGDSPARDNPLSLQVSRLCHVTHIEQEQQIRAQELEEENFCFTTNRKLGKSFDGKTYRFQTSGDSYKHIPENEEVFPGFYSWWGLYVETPIPALVNSRHLPNYLQDPPNSIYGTRAILIDLHPLLELYASARGCVLGRVCFRIGGTMRYKREIAYVIIVCTVNDKHLSRYGPISDAPKEILDMQGLDDGRIADKTCFPLFTTHHYNTTVSHEALNFAFYFPEQQEFLCSSDAFHVKKIEHTGCIRKRQLNKWYDTTTDTFTRDEICPDKITDKRLQTHENVTAYASSYTQSHF